MLEFKLNHVSQTGQRSAWPQFWQHGHLRELSWSPLRSEYKMCVIRNTEQKYSHSLCLVHYIPAIVNDAFILTQSKHYALLKVEDTKPWNATQIQSGNVTTRSHITSYYVKHLQYLSSPCVYPWTTGWENLSASPKRCELPIRAYWHTMISLVLDNFTTCHMN